MSSPSVISFLRDCLAEDRANHGIDKLDASSIRSRHFITGEDRALGLPLGVVDLPHGAAQLLRQKALLLRRECELVHGSWLISGNHEGRSISLPVLLHPIDPASIDGNSFPLDPLRWRLNPALFETLDLAPEIEKDIAVHLADGMPGTGGMLAIARLLLDHLPKLTEAEAPTYPQLASTREISESRKQPGLRLHPASLILLCERSRNVRGVLDELERLAELSDEQLGPPLRHLLQSGIRLDENHRITPRPNFVPALLSRSQQETLESCSRDTLTLCQGPPGTGKTFTLSAAAIDHANQGQPVLIVCSSRQAADVVERTIDGLLDYSDLTLRAGDKRGLKKLRDQLDKLLLSERSLDSPTARESARKDKEFRNTHSELLQNIHDFEQQLNAAYGKGHWFEDHPDANWWHRFQRWREERGIRRRPLLFDGARRLGELQEQRIRAARERVRYLHRYRLQRYLEDPKVRPSLFSYREALSKRASGAQEAALSEVDVPLLLKVFPIWIIEADDVHRLLPLEPGLFSLVILDEASQSNIASALPVLHRGKRALVSGDPKQLRHLSFLSESRIQRLAERRKLPPDRVEAFHFRRRSLIDVAKSTTISSHLLTEHFRSRPELIRFSNQEFYADQLLMMSEAKSLAKRPPATITLQINGNRDKAGVNHQELIAAAKHLKDWLANTASGSVGFLSPFRSQVDAFEKVLREELSTEELSRLIHHHQLIASTAHGFQGDERDLMILSFALTPECPSATRRFLEREDVFNVAISRARERIVAITSVSPRDLPSDSLLSRWLISLELPYQPTRSDVVDPLIDEISELLTEKGCRCEVGHSIAGVPIDILVRRNGKQIALDLVGQHGERGGLVPVQQNLLLQRAGLHLYPIGIGEWRTQPHDCVVAALTELDRKANPGFK